MTWEPPGPNAMEAPSKPGAAQEVPIRSGGANMVTPAEGAVAAGEEEGDPIVAMVMRAMQSDNIDATLYMLVRATFEVFPKDDDLGGSRSLADPARSTRRRAEKVLTVLQQVQQDSGREIDKICEEKYSELSKCIEEVVQMRSGATSLKSKAAGHADRVESLGASLAETLAELGSVRASMERTTALERSVASALHLLYKLKEAEQLLEGGLLTEALDRVEEARLDLAHMTGRTGVIGVNGEHQSVVATVASAHAALGEEDGNPQGAGARQGASGTASSSGRDLIPSGLGRDKRTNVAGPGQEPTKASRRVDLSAAEGPILSCMEGVVDRVARAALERVNAWLVVARRSAGTLGRQKIKEAALVLQQQAKAETEVFEGVESSLAKFLDPESIADRLPESALEQLLRPDPSLALRRATASAGAEAPAPAGKAPVAAPDAGGLPPGLELSELLLMQHVYARLGQTEDLQAHYTSTRHAQLSTDLGPSGVLRESNRGGSFAAPKAPGSGEERRGEFSRADCEAFLTGGFSKYLDVVVGNLVLDVMVSQRAQLWTGASQLPDFVSSGLSVVQSLLRAALTAADDPLQMLAVKNHCVNAALSLRLHGIDASSLLAPLSDSQGLYMRMVIAEAKADVGRAVKTHANLWAPPAAEARPADAQGAPQAPKGAPKAAPAPSKDPPVDWQVEVPSPTQAVYQAEGLGLTPALFDRAVQAKWAVAAKAEARGRERGKGAAWAPFRVGYPRLALECAGVLRRAADAVSAFLQGFASASEALAVPQQVLSDLAQDCVVGPLVAEMRESSDPVRCVALLCASVALSGSLLFLSRLLPHMSSSVATREWLPREAMATAISQARVAVLRKARGLTLAPEAEHGFIVGMRLTSGAGGAGPLPRGGVGGASGALGGVSLGNGAAADGIPPVGHCGVSWMDGVVPGMAQAASDILVFECRRLAKEAVSDPGWWAPELRRDRPGDTPESTQVGVRQLVAYLSRLATQVRYAQMGAQDRMPFTEPGSPTPSLLCWGDTVELPRITEWMASQCLAAVGREVILAWSSDSLSRVTVKGLRAVLELCDLAEASLPIPPGAYPDSAPALDVVRAMATAVVSGDVNRLHSDHFIGLVKKASVGPLVTASLYKYREGAAGWMGKGKAGETQQGAEKKDLDLAIKAMVKKWSEKPESAKGEARGEPPRLEPTRSRVDDIIMP